MSKNFCFTINKLPWVEPSHTDIKYMVYQMEKGTHEHIQGFVQFTCSKRLPAVKEILGNNAHVEVMRGSCEQARSYCMKLETRLTEPKEYGTMSQGQGARTDLNRTIGMSMHQIAREHPETYLRYHRALQSRLDLQMNMPNLSKWRIYWIDDLEELQSKTVYYIRAVSRLDPEGTGVIWDYSWDYYQYEECAVSPTPIEWTPYVKAIYRGMIINKVKELYVCDKLRG